MNPFFLLRRWGAALLALCLSGLTYANFAPATISFGNVVVGTSSVTQTAVLTNPTTGPITITIIDPPTAAFIFHNGTSTCAVGVVLPRGGTCTAIYQFRPVTTGPTLSAPFFGTTNGAYTITLQGNGITASSPLTLNPTAIDFGSVNVGSTSPPQTVTVSNPNPTPASITQIFVATGFPNTTTCGTTLAPLASCVVTVQAAPTVAGRFSGLLSVNSSVGNASLIMSGAGVAVVASPPTVSPASINFGNVNVGSTSPTQTVTLSNPNTVAINITSIVAPGGFVSRHTCGPSLAAMANCSITVQATPNGAGPFSGVLAINSSAGNVAVAMSGTGVAGMPSLSVSPPTLVFGTVAVGAASAPQTITLENNGTGAASPITMSLPAGLLQTNTCGNSLGAGARCAISVTYAPATPGSLNDRILITSGAAILPVGVLGTAVQQSSNLVVTPTTLAFGNHTVGTPALVRDLSVSNTGNAPATNLSVGLTGAAGFTQNHTCGTSLPVGGACTVSVRFAAPGAGLVFASLSISTATQNVTVALSAAGVVATGSLSATPQSVDFGSIVVGAGSPGVGVTLFNSGAATITPLSLAVSAPFNQVNDCGSALAPMTACRVTLGFSPSVASTVADALVITAGAQTLRVPLSGAGVTGSERIAVNPGSLQFGDVTVGASSAEQSITVSNVGTGPTRVSVDSSAGPFEVNNRCSTAPVLALGGACTVGVRFRPIAPGAASGRVTVSNGTQSLVVNLLGNGTRAAALEANTNVINFGDVPVGSSSAVQTVTLRNSGGTALSGLSIALNGAGFVQTNTCASGLAPLATCTVSVRFTPPALGVIAGNALISSGSVSLAIALSGNGTTAPLPADPTVSPTVLSFGSIRVGELSAPQQVVVNNPATIAVAISSIVASSGYSQSNDCGATLAAGASCRLQIRFAPIAVGPTIGTITLQTPNRSVSVALSGTGTAASVVTPAGGVTSVSPTRTAIASSAVSTFSALYTFADNAGNVRPMSAAFCDRLAAPLPPSGTSTANPCASGGEIAGYAGDTQGFQFNRVGAGIASASETVTVPAAVGIYAFERARATGESTVWFVRRFQPESYAIVELQVGGSAAAQPITLNEVQLAFVLGDGRRDVIANVATGGTLPRLEATLLYTGSGVLRGAWELVQPGDPEPEAFDLLAAGSVPIQDRGRQRRYLVVQRFEHYLTATGRVLLPPPDMSRFTTEAPGPHRILLRIDAEPAITQTGVTFNSGAAPFALPTVRYLVDQAELTMNATWLAEWVEIGKLQRVQWQETRPRSGSGFRRDSEIVAGAKAPVPTHRVEIVQADGTPLYTGIAAAEARRFDLPPVLAAMSKGKPVRGRVVRFGADRKPVVASEWKTFSFEVVSATEERLVDQFDRTPARSPAGLAEAVAPIAPAVREFSDKARGLSAVVAGGLAPTRMGMTTDQVESALAHLQATEALAALLGNPEELMKVAGISADAKGYAALSRAYGHLAKNPSFKQLQQFNGAVLEAVGRVQPDAIVFVHPVWHRQVANVTDEALTLPRPEALQRTADWQRLHQAEQLLALMELGQLLDRADTFVDRFGQPSEVLSNTLERLELDWAEDLPAMKAFAATQLITEMCATAIRAVKSFLPQRIDEFYVRIKGIDQAKAGSATPPELAVNEVAPVQVMITHSTYGGTVKTPWGMIELIADKLLKSKRAQAMLGKAAEAGKKLGEQVTESRLAKRLREKLMQYGHQDLVPKIAAWVEKRLATNKNMQSVYTWMKSQVPDLTIKSVKSAPVDLNSDRVVLLRSRSTAVLRIETGNEKQFAIKAIAPATGTAGFDASLKPALAQRLQGVGGDARAVGVVSVKKEPPKPPELRGPCRPPSATGGNWVWQDGYCCLVGDTNCPPPRK